MLQRHKTLFFLGLCIVVSIFLHVVRFQQVPACMNADEAAFGYNAYSILLTGRDEYGRLFPLRLQSFNDFKLPLYTYASMPFIAIGGLSVVSVRMVALLASIAHIPLAYLLVQEVTRRKKMAYLTAGLIALSPWIHIIGRHAHETVLASLFILISTILFVKYLRLDKAKLLMWSWIAMFVATFAYHTGRVYFVVFLMFYLSYILYKKLFTKQHAALFLIGLTLLLSSLGVDYIYGANRVSNLSFVKDIGFQLALDEELREHPQRIVHNKATEAIRKVTFNYLQQFSPNFLVIDGDLNPRFGYKNIGLITPVEYVFMFIGAVALLGMGVPGWFILTLLMISPIGNALTWQQQSVTRVYFMVIPLTIAAVVGMDTLLNRIKKKSLQKLLLLSSVMGYIFFLGLSWDYYLYHYFKKAEVQIAWQCGYPELFSVLKKYPTEKIRMTTQLGQPYIFQLFYNRMDPATAQRDFTRTPADQYGFTQVAALGRFVYSLPEKPVLKSGEVLVGYPFEFEQYGLTEKDVTKVAYKESTIFWVYKIP